MNLQLPGSVRIGRLAASLATGILIGALLLPSAAIAANGGATKLAISASSLVGNATAGVSFTLTVQARDNSDAVTTGFTDAVAFSSSDTQAIVAPGSPYTYLAGDNGSRVFTVTLKTAGSRTVTFSSAGLASAVATITVDPGAASTLAFTQQPSTSPSGVAFLTQPRVAVQDAFGNTIVADATTKVTLTLVAPTRGGPGTLAGCTAAATVSAGVASFGACSVTGTGIGYKLTATDTTGAGGGHPYTSATSAFFDVPDNLGWETQPSASSQGGIAFASQPKVTVRVGTSNFTTNKADNDGTTTVTLAIRSGTGAAGAVLTCDQASNTMKTTAGSAQFTGCRIDKAGTGYQLVATSVPAYGGNAWYSNTFNVVAGPPTKLMFVTQPAGASAGLAFTTQPVVAITDAGGNVATSGVSANVTLSIGTNPGVPAGVLTCSAITVPTATSGANAGKAVFSGCKITNSGVGYTLVASASSILPNTTTLAPGTSAAFTVGAPTASITLTTSAPMSPGGWPTITWGGGIILTTQFGTNGGNKTFKLQATRDNVTWFDIGPLLTTNASGRNQFAFRPSTNFFYRAVFAGTPDLAAGTSAPVRTVVRQIALLRPTNGGAVRSISRNTSITFFTVVRPSRPELTPAKVTFSFYRLSGSTWVLSTQRTVTAAADGRAATTFKFSTSGQWYVRSMANPTTYNANSVMSTIERYRVN